MSEATPDQSRNLALSERAFAAFSADRFDELLAIADPEVEVFASSDLANSGSFSGHEGLMTWMGAWLEAWEDFKIEVRRMEPVGERHVLTTVLQSAQGKGSGIPVEMEVTFLAEVEAEKFVALYLYTSWEDALRVAQQREEG